jgi:hypothetical protein
MNVNESELQKARDAMQWCVDHAFRLLDTFSDQEHHGPVEWLQFLELLQSELPARIEDARKGVAEIYKGKAEGYGPHEWLESLETLQVNTDAQGEAAREGAK